MKRCFSKTLQRCDISFFFFFFCMLKRPLTYGNFNIRKHGHGSIFARTWKSMHNSSNATFPWYSFFHEYNQREPTTKDTLIVPTFARSGAIKLLHNIRNDSIIAMKMETSFLEIRLFIRVIVSQIEFKFNDLWY